MGGSGNEELCINGDGSKPIVTLLLPYLRGNIHKPAMTLGTHNGYQGPF